MVPRTGLVLGILLFCAVASFAVACDPVEPTASLCGGDGCRVTATYANFTVEAGEGCDDGKTVAGDGCSARCTVEPGFDCCGSPGVCGRKGAAPLVAGGAHTCAVRPATPADPDWARLAGDALACWGENNFWQLGRAHRERVGDNETPGSEPPVRLGGSVMALAAGSEHTCALLTSGAVRCFGNGKNGRLGYGRPNHVGDNEHPEDAGDVPLGGRAIAVAAGARHTCAVLEGGAVRCWGAGETGALGYTGTNDIGDDETPASVGDVPLVGPASAMAPGVDHTCALLAPVMLGSAVIAVEGAGRFCAVTAERGLHCWGALPLGYSRDEYRNRFSDVSETIQNIAACGAGACLGT
jgi:cysteine-rich repeat protein